MLPDLCLVRAKGQPGAVWEQPVLLLPKPWLCCHAPSTLQLWLCWCCCLEASMKKALKHSANPFNNVGLC